MVNKILNVVGIMLLGFAISYMVSAVFDKLGFSLNIMINSIIIIMITVLLLTALTIIINLLFVSRQKTDSK